MVFKAMKKHFLRIICFGLVSALAVSQGEAKNPNELTHDQIVKLASNINNELMVKDIPELDNKIVVVDIEGNVILEETLANIEAEKATSDVKKLINKSSFLMEYAGNSYYILEK